MSKEITKQIYQLSQEKMSRRCISWVDTNPNFNYNNPLHKVASEFAGRQLEFDDLTLPTLFTKGGSDLLLRNCLRQYDFWQVVNEVCAQQMKTWDLDGMANHIQRAINTIRCDNRTPPFPYSKVAQGVTQKELAYLVSNGALLLSPKRGNVNNWDLIPNPLWFYNEEIEEIRDLNPFGNT